jgi:hypothetical protein
MGILDRFRGSTSSISCEAFGQRLAGLILVDAAATTTVLEQTRSLPGYDYRAYDRLKGALYVWGARLVAGLLGQQVSPGQGHAIAVGLGSAMTPAIAQQLGIAEAEVVSLISGELWQPLIEAFARAEAAPEVPGPAPIVVGVEIITRLACGEPVSNDRLTNALGGYTERLNKGARDQIARVHLQDLPYGN